ncbi:cupin domain-containing protein [Streptomyces sp. NPDC006430]|uniref:cupin domain-containing protein n=1 Tax=Streptomyces sp. NPDC006430 TaxID=3154299 RepID=UPI0033A28AF1
MTIRTGEPDNAVRAHGLDLKLLQPWPGLEAPFRGAWCILRPGDVSEAHAHHERELFIALSGRAEVVCNGRRHALAAGDIALMRAATEHFVVNEHDEDFSYYAIWWGRSMSEDFLAHELRHEGGETDGADSTT